MRYSEDKILSMTQRLAEKAIIQDAHKTLLKKTIEASINTKKPAASGDVAGRFL